MRFNEIPVPDEGLEKAAERIADLKARRQLVLHLVKEGRKIPMGEDGVFAGCKHLKRMRDNKGSILYAIHNNEVRILTNQCAECDTKTHDQIVKFFAAAHGGEAGYTMEYAREGDWQVKSEIALPPMMGLDGECKQDMPFAEFFNYVNDAVHDVTIKSKDWGRAKIFCKKGNHNKMMMLPPFDGSPMDLIKTVVVEYDPDCFVFVSSAWCAKFEGGVPEKMAHGDIAKMKDKRKEVLILYGMDKLGNKRTLHYNIKRQVPNDDTSPLIGLELDKETMPVDSVTTTKMPVLVDGKWSYGNDD